MLDNQPESTKVLGITATPRRDADGINMANEVAQKLGYTNREAVSGKHIAMNMSLTNAIRMGLVVNPKLVSCAYSLKTDGSLDKLKGKIDQIEDVQDRNEKLEEYESLRRNVENAEGIPQILQANVKKGGKYMVFLPIVDELEDEDGNVIGRKKGKDKIADYEKQIAEYFKGSDMIPNFHSMLGEYGDKENSRRLEEFQKANSEKTEFMLVMNKANEGLHLDKLDGMIWLRPIDENSKILYLQQLGRVIYSEDPDNPTKDEDRPVVIDLVNNTLKVNWEKEITEQDDIQMLNLIVDWAERHDGTLPNINSSDKEETGYATVLKEIQNKYKEYLKNGFDGLNEKQIEEVKEIIKQGSQIDLWQIELQDRTKKEEKNNKNNIKNKNRGIFKLSGLFGDFIELKYGIEEENTANKFIKQIEILKKIGVDMSKISRRDTIGTLSKKSGLDEKLLQKNGLLPSEKIGNKLDYVRKIYREKENGISLTEEQISKLRSLGIILEKRDRDVTQEFIEELKRLQKIGVDVSNISTKDTIKTLARKSGVDEILVQKSGFELDKPIGRTQTAIVRAYRGTNKIKKPTKEQVRQLNELEIQLIKRDITQELIDKLEKLNKMGVDVSKIIFRDTIQTIAESSGVNKERLEEEGFRMEDKIGEEIHRLIQRTRGTMHGTKATEEQIDRLKQLGIRLGKRNITQELIDKLEKLNKMGVDVSKITNTDTIQTLAEKSGVSREQLEKSGIKPEDKIGSNKHNITKVYRGQESGIKPTEEQVKRLLELGINLENKKRTSKEIAEASISSLTDIEMSDREDAALKELVEKTKEGGMNLDEQS